MDSNATKFSLYVDEWDTLVGHIEQVKKQLEPYIEKEREMRKQLAAAVKEQMRSDWKEGTNSYRMHDGRKLKIVDKRNRKVDIAFLAACREEYNHLPGSNELPFDDLFRVKYEVEKKEYDKLSEVAATVINKAITITAAMPEVTLG